MLKMMGQSEYGLYSLVASVISYLTILDLGFGNAIIRYTSKFITEGKKEEQYQMFGMFLVLYIIIGIVSVIIGLGFYSNVDLLFGQSMTTVEIERARLMLLILLFNLGVTFPMSIFTSIITAYERFVFPRVINIIRILLNTLLMVVLLNWGYRALAMVILQTVFNVATLIINYIYCKNKLHIIIKFKRFNFVFLKEVSVYSFWIFLNVIMDKIYWSTGQFVLGATAGTVAIAVFAVSIQLMYMYMQLSTAVSGVFLPKVTGMITLKSTNEEISNLFIKVGRIQNIVMVVVLLGFFVFGKAFIRLWAGVEYEGSYIITLLFFLSLYVPLIQNLGITILQARSQMRFRSLTYIAIAILSLVFQILFSKTWGGLGCAIAIAGALLLGQGLIMNIYYKIKQNINIRLFWGSIFHMNSVPVLFSIFFFYIIKGGDCIDSWIKLMSYIIVYGIIMMIIIFLFGMNKEEKKLVYNVVEKMVHVKNRY